VQQLAMRPRVQSKSLFVALLAAVIFVVALAVRPLQAQTYSLLYNFSGGSQGYGPGGIVVAPNGTVYGVASYGNCACALLFSFADGKETVLHRFSEPPGNQGEIPQGLLLSKDGTTLYGTTMWGGTYKGNCGGAGVGCGISFSYDLTENKYKVTHVFTGPPADGAYPTGMQALDSSGDLFGLTLAGGTNHNGSYYELTAAGTEKVIYSFGDAPDGIDPNSGLVLHNGNYFGTTTQGGANICNNTGNNIGCGTVFKIHPTGEESVVYSFTGGADGQSPFDLVADSNGDLYGLSFNPETSRGPIFEISSTGKFSIAYDGSFLSQILWIIPGPNGSLYGVASGGNSGCQPNGCGQISQLTPTGGGNGTVTILHQFDGTDGSLPSDASIVVHNGVIYGATGSGGTTGDGVLFTLKP
jgi:hypothetical protein